MVNIRGYNLVFFSWWKGINSLLSKYFSTWAKFYISNLFLDLCNFALALVFVVLDLHLGENPMTFVADVFSWSRHCHGYVLTKWQYTLVPQVTGKLVRICSKIDSLLPPIFYLYSGLNKDSFNTLDQDLLEIVEISW